MGILSFFSREKKQDLDKGLEKTKNNFFGKLSKAIVGKSVVDDDVLDNLEEILVNSDVGVQTTLKIIDRIQQRVLKDKYVGTSELNKILRDEITSLLSENDGIGLITGFDFPKRETPYLPVLIFLSAKHLM